MLNGAGWTFVGAACTSPPSAVDAQVFSFGSLMNSFTITNLLGCDDGPRGQSTVVSSRPLCAGRNYA
ncbi:hypothetical protein D9M68_101850 [compost metagenome]